MSSSCSWARVERVERPERLVHQQAPPVPARGRGPARRAGACRQTAPVDAGARRRSRRTSSSICRARSRRSRRGTHEEAELDVAEHGAPREQGGTPGTRPHAGDPGRAPAVPSTSTAPAVGATKPATTCSSVDLPHPDGPSTATSEPAATSRSIPSRATTSSRRSPKTLTMPRASIIGRARTTTSDGAPSITGAITAPAVRGSRGRRPAAGSAARRAGGRSPTRPGGPVG